MNLSLKQVWRPLHTMSYLKNYQKMNLTTQIIFLKGLCVYQVVQITYDKKKLSYKK